MKVAIYDIETYPNIFTVVFYVPEKDLWKTYEVSPRRNDFKLIKEFISALKRNQYYMVGFNNLAFDYPVIHEILKLSEDADWKTVISRAKFKAEQCINTDFFNKNAYVIWDRDQRVKQIDLMKVWHFDRKAVSLKMLEFCMRLRDIQELPFDPKKDVPEEGFDKLIEYNKYDVFVTNEFYNKSKKALEFRVDMNKVYPINALNKSNTAIGEAIVVKEVEKRLGKEACYSYEDGGRVTKQTEHGYIELKGCILPHIKFDSIEFNFIKQFFEDSVITETKGVMNNLEPDRFKNKEIFKYCETVIGRDGEVSKVEKLNINYKGLNYVFGVGGLHASKHNETYITNDEWVLLDEDVISYYPSLPESHRFFPEHLSEEGWCGTMTFLKSERKKFPKGTSMNAGLKEAANASYGKSNDEYSPIRDTKYTMKTTLTGQLSLCMLVERVTSIISDETGEEGVKVIQANTDGITCYVRRDCLLDFRAECDQWEQDVKLKLESAQYQAMYIRDVNNYLAVYENGNVKRIGEYNWNLLQEGNEQWHKDLSALVIPMAVEKYLVEGKCYKEFLREHDDIYDFMYRTKIKRSDNLYILDDMLDRVEQQRITRYYLSTDGTEMMKVSPPRKNKKVTDKIRTAWGRMLRDYGLAKTIKQGKTMLFTKEQEAKINLYMMDAKSFTIDDVVEKDMGKLKPLVVEALSHCQPAEHVDRIQKGKLVTVANTITEDFKLVDLDYEAYEEKIEKLLIGVNQLN